MSVEPDAPAHGMSGPAPGLDKPVQARPPYLTVTFIASHATCNLACPYCITDWKSRRAKPDEPALGAIFDGITRLPRPVSLIASQMGEFFTSPELQTEVALLCNGANNLVNISLFTNLRADWERTIGPFLEGTDTSRLSMFCTLHDSVIPPREVERFFDKVKRLRDRGVLVFVSFLVRPGDIARARLYKQRCDALGVRFCVLPLQASGAARDEADALRVDREAPLFSREEMAELRTLCESPHIYQTHFEIRTPFGLACGAGRDYVHIAASGDVYTCLPLKSRGPIGNIVRGEIRFPDRDMACPMPFCFCPHEAAALRLVDMKYTRGRDSRMLTPRDATDRDSLYAGYAISLYRLNAARRLLPVSEPPPCAAERLPLPGGGNTSV